MGRNQYGPIISRNTHSTNYVTSMYNQPYIYTCFNVNTIACNEIILMNTSFGDLLQFAFLLIMINMYMIMFSHVALQNIAIGLFIFEDETIHSKI